MQNSCALVIMSASIVLLPFLQSSLPLPFLHSSPPLPIQSLHIDVLLGVRIPKCTYIGRVYMWWLL